MKTPLRYQATEYDCGPTSMTNAIVYMFDREEIPPDLIRHIGQGTLDSFDENGHAGRYGTSGAAIRYFGSWLNELRYAGLLPIESSYAEKDEVFFGHGSRLTEALNNSSAVVLHVYLNGYGHYILITGKEGRCCKVFDPYYTLRDPARAEIIRISSRPFSHNLLVPEEILNSTSTDDYSMGAVSTREALIISRYHMNDLYII